MLRRTANQALHLAVDVAIGVLGLVAVAALVAAWRLAQGPIDITRIALRNQARIAVPGLTIKFGGAALAWEGFSTEDQPLDIRLSNLDIARLDGSLAAHIPDVRITLSLRALVLGQIVPRLVTLDHASITLTLPAASTSTATAAPATPTDGIAPAAILGAITAQAGPLTELDRVHLADAALLVNDTSSGRAWRAPHADIAAHRLPDGAVAIEARLDLTVGGVTAPITAAAELRPSATHLTASLGPVSPADLAAAIPALAPAAAAAAPVTVKAEAAFGPGLTLQTARLALAAGAGTLAAGKGSVALQSAQATLVAEPGAARLENLRIAFAPLPGHAPPPVLTGTASATRANGHIAARFSIAAGPLDLGDLGLYWPLGTGGGARGWIVANLTHGHAHDTRIAGAIDMPADFSTLQVTALSGGLAADDVTVFWLKPVPPLTHGTARLKIEGPDSLLIAMDQAEQDALHLRPGSSIRITKLEENHQFADIDARIDGPLETTLRLLNHKRLNLLSRSKLDFTNPAGQIGARLTMHIPLEDRVTMDDIPVTATATLTGVHLGHLAIGRDLDQAALRLKVDNDGLSVEGAGQFAGLPTTLRLGMDFRAGPPSQVVQHATARATATAGEAVKAGLPASARSVFAAGSASLAIDYAAHRDNTATVQLDADLAAAQLATKLNWAKPAGPAATAGARFLLDHGKLIAVDHLHADAPDLALAGALKLQNGQPRTLLIDRLALGRTRATGQVDLPAPGRPLALRLTGAMLDLAANFETPPHPGTQPSPPDEGKPNADKPGDDKPGDDKPGDPWRVALDFAAIRLAKGETLSNVRLSAESDGLHVHSATMSAAPAGSLTLRLVPEGATRRLSLATDEAGSLLRGLGIADNITGGTLDLAGTFDDRAPGAPLTGTATLTDFTVSQAPVVARLLQAVTLYGMADVLRGPGLHVGRAVAPFRWQRRVLHLQNARAFSPSLGVTAAGDIDLRRRTLALTGTLVPAYFFNRLLGDLPIIGRLFSPEQHSGLFAARYSIGGTLKDPDVSINPLSALTPGFLRDGFGLLDTAPAQK